MRGMGSLILWCGVVRTSTVLGVCDADPYCPFQGRMQHSSYKSPSSPSLQNIWRWCPVLITWTAVWQLLAKVVYNIWITVSRCGLPLIYLIKSFTLSILK